MSYCVQCLDGPAEGFTYITMVPPPERITLAPLHHREGEWFRAPEGSPPWDGQCDYQREPAGIETNSDGDIIANYLLATDETEYFAVLDHRGVGQIRHGTREGQSRVVCHVSSHWEMENFFRSIKAGHPEADAIEQRKGDA